ncbi:MAG: alpha/beta fold hydrolase [Myxococcota bacterium]|nr:alpha/beta fold hydrolase [Myxococcota bacterium]
MSEAIENIELQFDSGPGGLSIRCDVAGQASEPDRPLVLVHGLTGHRKDFELVLPVLARHGRVLAPDLRGHGDASLQGSAEGHDFATLVEDLRALLDGLGVERCDLLGHSFGGMLALRFVLAYPERVASLVLMGTSCEPPDDYSREMFEKAGGFATSRGLDELQARLEETGRRDEDPLPDDASEEQRDWRARYWDHHRLRIRAMDPWAYGTLGVAMMDQATVTDRLGEISCPTSVIIGLDDREFVRGARLLVEGIPNAVEYALGGIGHQPHQEAKARFLEIMAEHLDAARSA